MLSSPSGNCEQVGLKVDDFYQKVYMNIFLPWSWSWDEISHGQLHVHTSQSYKLAYKYFFQVSSEKDVLLSIDLNRYPVALLFLHRLIADILRIVGQVVRLVRDIVSLFPVNIVIAVQLMVCLLLHMLVMNSYQTYPFNCIELKLTAKHNLQLGQLSKLGTLSHTPVCHDPQMTSNWYRIITNHTQSPCSLTTPPLNQH